MPSGLLDIATCGVRTPATRHGSANRQGLILSRLSRAKPAGLSRHKLHTSRARTFVAQAVDQQEGSSAAGASQTENPGTSGRVRLTLSTEGWEKSERTKCYLLEPSDCCPRQDWSYLPRLPAHGAVSIDRIAHGPAGLFAVLTSVVFLIFRAQMSHCQPHQRRASLSL